MDVNHVTQYSKPMLSVVPQDVSYAACTPATPRVEGCPPGSIDLSKYRTCLNPPNPSTVSGMEQWVWNCGPLSCQWAPGSPF